jgi:hypothetical protein
LLLVTIVSIADYFGGNVAPLRLAAIAVMIAVVIIG